MDNEKFKALLVLIVRDVIKVITEKYGWDEIKAINEFYSSGLYADLEDEETKLWHLSPLALFDLFDEEQKTGKITYPEEA